MPQLLEVLFSLGRKIPAVSERGDGGLLFLPAPLVHLDVLEKEALALTADGQLEEGVVKLLAVNRFHESLLMPIFYYNSISDLGTLIYHSTPDSYS